MSQKCIIVGMSHAGIHLATSLRQYGWQGEILMIGNEDILPYHRPPLSKTFLKKQSDTTLIYPESNFEKYQIQFRLSTSVDFIQIHNKSIELDSGEVINYDKLALCTGGRARKLNIRGSKLEGVHYLRDIRDAQKLREHLKYVKKVVIIGAGFIGLEIAAVLVEQGIEVTVVEANSRILSRNLDEAMSNYFMQLHAEHGVEIKTNIGIREIQGQHHVESVLCDDGSKFDADAVIIGIGVIPNVELALTAELEIENGIVVDKFACTSNIDIVAAGDCTFFPSNHLQRSVRLECLANAVDQAKTAAATLSGNSIPHSALPWFWSEQYDKRLQVAGVIDHYEQVIIRQSFANGGFSRLYFQGNLLKMAVCVNSAKDFIAAKQLIVQKTALDLNVVQTQSDLKKCVLKK
ncbi:NAD(P)/FAD-dependent oxidoreductase [Acinetobacter guillouiae]|uniref:NAD(P)/FAD-dependent oxidoreductase n=1 Tax=Acinetobacter guillouiae TaxID=106649 RepID=UPI001AE311AE|nr:FAD-dependent oxidoreductase [Acinetobacter guillouiae]MBP2543166.1 3-phenylpropionate/trans-cinnamate dioxygenase ferredoxin reductase subunit [Acinetobacter guillouiae]